MESYIIQNNILINEYVRTIMYHFPLCFNQIV